MLSAEAIQERMWAPFPVLRQALQSMRVPERYYGFTSVSDNMFDSVRRAATLVVLVREFGPKIAEVANLVGKEKMLQDLQRLERFFEQERSLFDDGINAIRELGANL